jgi:hypothetical protein
MSTAPAAPITPSVPAQITAAQTWLQKHERIIIVLIVCALGAWGIQRYYDGAALAAATKATVAEAHATTADATAAKDAATQAQVNQQYQVMVQTLTEQNKQLATALATRQAQVVVQQKTDTTLAPSALADRIATLSSAPPAEVTLDGANIALGRNAAVAVAQTLELVPVLQDNLKDETTLADNRQKMIDADTAEQIAFGKEITDLNAARTADAAACKAEVSAAKAQGRKSGVKWFKRGFIAGFLSGLWAGHAAGL